MFNLLDVNIYAIDENKELLLSHCKLDAANPCFENKLIEFIGLISCIDKSHTTIQIHYGGCLIVESSGSISIIKTKIKKMINECLYEIKTMHDEIYSQNICAASAKND